MAVVTTFNSDHYDYNHDNIGMEDVPPTIDPERPPQRNDDNATGTCACPCACSAPGAGDDVSSGDNYVQAIGAEPGQDEGPSRAISEAGDDVDDGDQGVEEHLIEVGDYGYIPLSLIYRTLAKHANCTCHHGVLPNSDDYPFSNYNSPVLSGRISPGDSMLVELNSGHGSAASSSPYSIPSRGSSVFEHMHIGIDYNAMMGRLPLLYNPLQLTPDIGVGYPMELSISSISGVSDRDLGNAADAFADFDMW